MLADLAARTDAFAASLVGLAESDTVRRTTRAPYRVALGEPYREAAKAEGYADHADIWRLATRYGLVQAKKERILNGTRRVALPSNEELERRLVEETDDISTRDRVNLEYL